MIKVSELYNMVVADDVNEAENGLMDVGRFNRTLKRAETNLLRFLTGDLVSSPELPIPWTNQKLKDYLSKFIAVKTANNKFALPENYYFYDNLYAIGNYTVVDCETALPQEIKNCSKPITIMDGQSFFNRCNTYISGLKPADAPIAKIVNGEVVMMPEDIGSVALEYIRYPKFGLLVMKEDQVMNDIVPDEINSVNLEWGEWATEYLIWFMVNKWSTNSREGTAMQINMANKPKG